MLSIGEAINLFGKRVGSHDPAGGVIDL